MATPNTKVLDPEQQDYSSDNSSQKNHGRKSTKEIILEIIRGHQRSDEATFDMTEDIRHYKPIDSYEGIHRWDPDFQWEEWEEKKIVRKVSPLHPLNSEIVS